MAMPLKNIAGQRFGKRVVLEHVANGWWNCRCDCGVVAVASGTLLRSGRSQSCVACAPKRQPTHRTNDERRAARQASLKKYFASEKGKAWHARFLASEARQRYIRSERHRELKRQRNKSEAYKRRRCEYRARTEVRAKEAEQRRAAYQKNPAPALTCVARRRARLAGLADDLTPTQWAALLNLWGGCAFCGSQKRITMEHVIAVSNGGGTTLGNIVPSCRSCNAKKWKLDLEEAARRLGFDRARFIEKQRAIIQMVQMQEAA